ncbi:MAG: DUF1223 domain-containing protein [Litoreibacter sp.]
MRNMIIALTTTLGLAAPMAATADQVLVELFTSQGCSSCPPADEVLGELAKRDDVIALSLHVDYWDYLGWKDSFSQPKFTLRQQTYAAAAHSTMIYTPQMMVGGVSSVVGTRAMELMDHITAHQKAPKVVDLSLTKSGGNIAINATMIKETSNQMVVQLVRYSPSESVTIKRGENAGRTIEYHNVVTDWTVLGAWEGDTPLDVEAAVEGDNPSVVIIQDGVSGPVLAVASID